MNIKNGVYEITKLLAEAKKGLYDECGYYRELEYSVELGAHLCELCKENEEEQYGEFVAWKGQNILSHAGRT